MASLRGTYRAVYAALTSNIALMLLKATIAALTGSSTILAESLHSASDTVNQLFLWFGLKLSGKRDKTLRFPFGRGKEQYFWSFVAAIVVIAVSSTQAVLEGVERMFNPIRLFDIHYAIAAVIIGLIFEGIALKISFSVFEKERKAEGYNGRLEYVRETKNSVLLAALLEDLTAVVGLLIALVALTFTWISGNTIFDAVGSIIIGGLLAVFGFTVARETRDLLIGEGLAKKDVENIRRLIKSHPTVNRVLDIRGAFFGADSVVLGVDINFRDGLTTDEIEGAVDEIERNIRAKYPFIKRIYLEAEELMVR